MDRALAFLNGMVGGWSQVLVMQPFQIIKIRLQTQSQTNKLYSGIWDCLVQIIKKEGPLALYKGSLTPLFGVGILGSVRIGFYQNFKKTYADIKGKHVSSLETAQKSLCALAAGTGSALLVCPVEHTRIRMQIQKSELQKVYTGSLDATIKIFKQYGIRGLNRGQGPTFVRESTGLVLFFTAIEKVTDMMTPQGHKDKKNLPVYVPFLAGGIGGTMYWMFNYPFDYVKTMMQSDKFGEFKYKSMSECFRIKYQQHGVKGFFKGYTICMMRSFPVNAAYIVTYRMMQRLSGATSH